MSAAAATIRRRSPDDLEPLAALLLRQQPTSRYPIRNPLPFPVADFLHAEDAEAAWTAERDARVVGHACWLRTPAAGAQRGVVPSTGAETTATEACAAAHGCEPEALAWVSALFVAPELRGSGLGGRLLQLVVDDMRAAGARPCLEVVDLNEAAVRRYRAEGWQEVLRARPAWLADAIDDPGIGTSTMVLLADG